MVCRLQETEWLDHQGRISTSAHWHVHRLSGICINIFLFGSPEWILAADGRWAGPIQDAFITKYGLYEYCKLPFGLCNAPSTFQRCMGLIFTDLQWQTLLIYLDDIIIFSSDMEEHLLRLEEVFQRIIKAGLKLKPPNVTCWKMRFFTWDM